MKDKEKEDILAYYCTDDMRKLIKLSNDILRELGRSNPLDVEEFYSIANFELFKATENYDENNKFGAKFETYLSVVLRHKFNSEFSRRKRQKRGGNIETLSLEANIAGLENVSIIDTISSGENIEEQVISQDSKIENYLSHLSKKEKEVANYIMEGYNQKEIAKKLGIQKNELEDIIKGMKSFERKNLLENFHVYNGESKNMDVQKTYGTMEKVKNDNYTTARIIKKMNDRTINFNHSLQRYAGQWSAKMKSDLISDILQGNPIPELIFAEQVINGCSIIFDLDGKQRCTTVKEFREGAFKISRSVSRNIIIYQHHVKDENGNVQVDENNYPVVTREEFDITNKKYSQLPDELKEAFDSYSFHVTLYLNCSNEDVAYHIQRYNQGKPMNGVQKGITRLGEDFARKVKEISAMPLFRDTNFKSKHIINGTVERVVVESVMAINFMNDWKKSPEEIAIYLDRNATFEMFEEVEDCVQRLQDIITEKSGDLFNLKNTFIWITLFTKFKQFKIDDIRFNDFLEKFVDELQYRKIDGDTFLTIDESKNTKDKQQLIKKLNYLETLLNEFLNEEM